MKKLLVSLMAIGCLQFVVSLYAQVPGIINYQGRVAVGGTNFDGTGQFQFALVDSGGTTNYWSNDGTPTGEPVTAVSLTVTKGLYSVLLGDTTIPNMAQAIPPETFTNADVRLRVWFDDGVSGFEQLAPDQRLAAVGYALQAQNAAVANGVSPSSVVQGLGLNVGVGNTLGGAYASIAGGSNNFTSGSYSFIGGGAGNIASGDYATVGGGGFNTASGFNSTIAGGGRIESNTASGWSSAIGGGDGNKAVNWEATVGGGSHNTASGYEATVAGGGTNTASGIEAFVGGGTTNTASGDDSTVGGGYVNTASGAYATVGGGECNAASNSEATVAGGSYNTASGNSATVGGGFRNIAGGSYATVGGGFTNTASGSYATIGGGDANSVQSGSQHSTIGGGGSITIQSSANNATIGGGGRNTIQANASYATIGGGGSITIQSGATYATIGGGEGNTIQSGVQDATIGGGEENIVSANLATIPGGHHAVAANYAQMAYSSGLFAASGDGQFSLYVLRGTSMSSNSTATLYLDYGTGSSLEIALPADRACAYTVRIVGRSSSSGGSGNCCAFCIRGGANGRTLVANNFNTDPVLNEFAPTYNPTPIITVTGGNKLRVQVSNPPNETVRWTATVETAEVSFP